MWAFRQEPQRDHPPTGPGAARSMMTNNRVEARRHLRTRLRRALGVRREIVRMPHCRLLQRLALLLSWGQVQDGRGAPRCPSAVRAEKRRDLRHGRPSFITVPATRSTTRPYAESGSRSAPLRATLRASAGSAEHGCAPVPVRVHPKPAGGPRPSGCPHPDPEQESFCMPRLCTPLFQPLSPPTDYPRRQLRSGWPHVRQATRCPSSRIRAETPRETVGRAFAANVNRGDQSRGGSGR